jgi:hypothetical protein
MNGLMCLSSSVICHSMHAEEAMSDARCRRSCVCITPRGVTADAGFKFRPQFLFLSLGRAIFCVSRYFHLTCEIIVLVSRLRTVGTCTVDISHSADCNPIEPDARSYTFNIDALVMAMAFATDTASSRLLVLWKYSKVRRACTVIGAVV